MNSKLRWNPILEEWVIIAPHRSGRPVLPKECPFCPGGDVPDEFEVISIPNRFPSLLPNSRSAKGFCEVVVYSPKHDVPLKELSTSQVVKLIELWAQRYEELGAYDFVKYVFIFENKGELIGVTLSHPHGQIYAFPFIPPIIERELKVARKWWRKGKCVFCEVIKKERRGRVFSNNSFVCFVPSFARFPYEVHLYPRRHFPSILELEDGEKRDLAESLKLVISKYDNHFSFELPYMMVLHQAPTDGKRYPYYHFHIEFYPLHRDRDKIKYRAGVETGAGTFINPRDPEEVARELRSA